jgi:hypothetical protein
VSALSHATCLFVEGWRKAYLCTLQPLSQHPRLGLELILLAGLPGCAPVLDSKNGRLREGRNAELDWGTEAESVGGEGARRREEASLLDIGRAGGGSGVGGEDGCVGLLVGGGGTWVDQVQERWVQSVSSRFHV